MPIHKTPDARPDADTGCDGTASKPSDEKQDENKLTPASEKIGEGPDNLRERGDAFQRRRKSTH